MTVRLKLASLLKLSPHDAHAVLDAAERECDEVEGRALTVDRAWLKRRRNRIEQLRRELE